MIAERKIRIDMRYERKYFELKIVITIIQIDVNSRSMLIVEPPVCKYLDARDGNVSSPALLCCFVES